MKKKIFTQKDLYRRTVQKDKGPVVRWFANRALDLATWLVRIAAPYGFMYELSYHEDDLDQFDDIETLLDWFTDPDEDSGAF